MATPIANERPAITVGHPAVPWLMIVPISVLMSFADGYWTTSLRGAFGAIERTQDPFGSWLRESTILLPAFMLAVLAALLLALRLFGPVPRAGRPIAVTSLLISTAGTVVGLAVLGLSTIYDYSLESGQLLSMNAMRDRCPTGDCLATQRHATLVLQERSLLMGAVLIMVTNAVMVGWVVAARGGRISIGTARRARAGERTSADDLRLLLIAGLVGSAVIHAAVVPEHLGEWPAAGMFFMALTIAELAVAAVLHLRPQSRALLAAAVFSVGPLMLWLCSRTIGLPLGPEPGVAEAVGVADVAACMLELATLGLAMLLLLASARLRHRPATVAHGRWLAVMAVLAVTAIGLSGSGLAGLNGFEVSPTQASTTSGHHG